MTKLFIFFAAGCVGGLANSLVLWQFGALGINANLGVALAPSLNPSWLYPRIVWGGLWGLLFILPFLQSKLFFKGTILSIFPTLVQLLIIFPYKTHKGIAGLELGFLTPVLVLFFNWIWGIASALAIKLAR
jgi:hypothetical protein